MYNCPRAATVSALGAGVLWAVDRATFRRLVVRSMADARGRHEAVLRGAPLFAALTDAQRAAIADCLVPEAFPVRAGAGVLSCAALCAGGAVEACHASLHHKKHATPRHAMPRHTTPSCPLACAGGLHGAAPR
jgi:hypothetical protein